MSDTFKITKKITKHKIKIKSDLIKERNIQANDYLLYRFNQSFSKRHKIRKIENEFCYLEEDNFILDSNLSILLDTNILIYREGDVKFDSITCIFKILNQKSINNLSYLDDSIRETKKNNNINAGRQKYLDSLKDKITNIYNEITIDNKEINSDILFQSLLIRESKKENDLVDDKFLYAIWKNKADLLLTNDNNIKRKSKILGIENRVILPLEFLKKILGSYNDLYDVEIRLFKIENVKLRNINYKDRFFDDLRKKYKGFNDWFIRKQKRGDNGFFIREKKSIEACLLLKIENKNDVDHDIKEFFNNENILKISTFKSISNIKVGEMFLYICFSQALKNNIRNIYTTFFLRWIRQRNTKVPKFNY